MKSMTGYGRAKYEIEQREYCVEIKSVNHKYCDISVKLPRSISYLEEKVKKMVAREVTRGKIDVFITFSNYSTKGKQITINHELATIYIEQLKEMARKNKIEQHIEATEISRFPDVLMVENREDEEIIWEELSGCLEEALENFIEMRQVEGNKMKEDLQTRIKEIEDKVHQISMYSTGLIEEYVVKLKERIQEILKTDVVDESRLAQEVVIYADKCSVEEEITRLKSHIAQFTKILKHSKAVGKKLDFIIQEMNRETNTIGSKANCLEITNLVIDVKTEIENIREQVQNIE